MCFKIFMFTLCSSCECKTVQSTEIVQKEVPIHSVNYATKSYRTHFPLPRARPKQHCARRLPLSTKKYLVYDGNDSGVKLSTHSRSTISSCNLHPILGKGLSYVASLLSEPSSADISAI